MARYRRSRGRGGGYGYYGMVGGAFYGMERLEDWRIRGEMARDYYKNTGYNPRYYNAIKRKRVKW